MRLLGLFIFSLLITSLIPALAFSQTESVAGKKPNIIWIYFDTLRADHLNAYGYHKDTSPAVDRLAREGVLFRKAVSQASCTYPSVSSAITALYPSHFMNGEDELSDDFLTVAEMLQQEGYQTVAISSSPIIQATDRSIVVIPDIFLAHSQSGAGQGFDEFIDATYGQDDPGWKSKGAENTVNEAIQWLNQNSEKPFFLFLFIIDPHDPYRPPESYRDLYGQLTSEEISELNQKRKSIFWKTATGQEGTSLSKVEIQQLRSLYDADLKYADDQLGRLMKRLEELRLFEESMIVFTSDHGEEFMEHGGMEHCTSLYRELIHVPLIFKYPKRLPQGKVVEKEIVQAVDIVPTLLDLADLPVPDNLSGASLRKLMQEGDPDWRDFAFSEEPHIESKALTTARWKYIHTFEIELFYPALSQRYKTEKILFDLNSDPGELYNVYSKYPEIGDGLYQKMLELLPEREKERIRHGRKNVYADETLEKMKSMGYLQ